MRNNAEMTGSEQTITRYLLGELTESERSALEESYFKDQNLFDQLQKAENDLLDDFARNRLSPPVRQRIEQRYLTHPELHARLRFAEALATWLDARDRPDSIALASTWAKFYGRFRTNVLAFSVGVASLLLLVVGALYFVSITARLREELRQVQAAQSDHERRERELQQQIAAEQARSDQLAGDVARLEAELDTAASSSKPSTPLTPSLILAIVGIRSPEVGPPATLVIPAGASQARVLLKLKDNDYPSYGVLVQSADGRLVFKRANLRPQNRGQSSLAFIVPASKLPNGDYILSVRGTSPGGESEDISKSLFRVERK